MNNLTRLTRRDFGKLAGTGTLALASGGIAGLVGCGNSGAFSDILAWVPIGISAIEGIVTLLGSLVPPGALAIIALVKAGLADLAATITQYQNDTDPTHKSSLLAKIRTILNDTVTNFQSFLDLLNINGPLETVVVGLANVILSALAGFLGELPGTGVQVLSATYRVGRAGPPHAYTPRLYKSVSDFKASYNAVADQNGHPEIEIH